MGKVILFLGAGASRTFGYPTTKEFLENLNEKLPNEESDILQSLRRLPDAGDVEKILEIIDPIVKSEPNRLLHSSLGKIGTSVPSINKNIAWKDYLRSIIYLKDKIIEDLHEQYKFNRSKIKEIVEIYNPLVRLLPCIEFDEEVERPATLTVATTNYDQVFEQYASADKNNVTLHDFFDYNEKTGKYYLNRWKRWGFREENVQVWYYKLHGSLNWRETIDAKIEKCETEEHCSNSEKHKRNVLIYPTQKGWEDEFPYDLLFRDFRRSCESARLVVAIGSSFRDIEVNQILINFLQWDKNNRLLAVSPSAQDNVSSNLLASISDKNMVEELLGQINSINKKLDAKTRDEILDVCFRTPDWRRL